MKDQYFEKTENKNLAKWCEKEDENFVWCMFLCSSVGIAQNRIFISLQHELLQIYNFDCEISPKPFSPNYDSEMFRVNPICDIVLLVITKTPM